MTEALMTKMKTQSINLPKNWKGKQVFVRITDDTATITKVSNSSNIFSKSEISSMRALGEKINKSLLKKALLKR